MPRITKAQREAEGRLRAAFDAGRGKARQGKELKQ
jgi:hypothetical protein